MFTRLGSRRLCAAAGGVSRLPEVNIYQYEICPYCNKVKAFLDWQQVPYKTMDVNPLTKGEIRFSKDYRKVPIAFIDGIQVNDSTEIIKKLVEALGRENVSQQLQEPEISKWVDWTDKKLAVLLFPNLTRTFGESFEAFGYIMNIPHMWLPMKMVNRLVGGWAMWMANDKIRKKYNIDDEREDLLKCVDEWTVDLAARGGKFHGGAKPDLADVAVYGCIRSLEGFTTHHWLLRNHTDLLTWYNRMFRAMPESSRLDRVFAIPYQELNCMTLTVAGLR
ncbi:hypothetical protein FOZ60_006780 [Perkinsus olseni]|uniref:GST N-terminal domain-containing protein n=1 Tax=Perkinsus olseni TaxID=32597 RepID=A0A7J6NMS2_PEROL|nr:hypothetical protein FOZ60_006780 [Perkinsus olseni]